MAAKPAPRRLPLAGWSLVASSGSEAARVAGWIREPEDAYWVAPRSRPPITPAEVRRWHAPGCQPYLICREATATPVAYGELNLMAGATDRYWLGHLLVDPALRGRGIGQVLTRLLLRQAFVRQGARSVTLVVFPDNVAAVRCYRAAGLRDDGCELHEFPAYGRSDLLLRMTATRYD